MTSKAWLDGGVQKRLPGDDVTETRLGASRMGAEVSAETDSARSTAARRRLKWGIVLALVSVLLGVAAQASAAWVSDSWPEVLVYFVMPGWTLILCCHLLSGAAALAALVLLVPALVARIPRGRIRRLTAVLAVLASATAALPWSIYAAGMGLAAAAATYAQVTASSGDSVVVEQSGFDPQTYSVYSQKSWGLWQRTVPWLSATEVFDPNDCILTDGSSDLVLHCGVDDVIVPRLGD
jgi:hypothetical protein